MSKKYPHGCGVYMATMPSGAFYVGRSINIYQRICNHYSDAKRGAHKNKWLARCLNKYGQRVKWVVLLHCTTEQDALAYERQYLEFWWGSEKLINQKKGDAFTALENERSKRKPVYAMNVWSGDVVRLNYVTEWGSMIGSRRCAKIPSSVYGESIEECNQKRLEKIRHDISRLCLRREYCELKRPAHKHLYFIWTKSRKWIVWGGDEAKRITSGLKCEYWVKTRTRKWKHKKPVTEGIRVRLYRIDAGEILCKSINEASRIIGCSSRDVHVVVYGKEGRKTTKGWTAELA